MNWCSSKFSEPTSLEGDWTDRRAAFFRHAGDPLSVKVAIEKTTCTLLQRAGDPRSLVFAGTSPGGPDPRSVCLTLEAVIDGQRFYSFTIDRAAPRRWTTEKAFKAEASRVFAFWCSKLDVVEPNRIDWAKRSVVDHEALVRSTTAAALAAASVVEDPLPVLALQREIVAALRTGRKGFFDAHKEGGMHLYFADPVFVRADFGESDRRETYADDAAVLDALRRYFEWETRREHYPHWPPALEAWRYIHGRLVDRDG